MSTEGPIDTRSDHQPVRLPTEIAQGFDVDTLKSTHQLVHEDGARTIWRCAEEHVSVPGIGPAGLRVDYAEYDQPGDPRICFDQMRFDYIKTEGAAPGQNPLIAEMHWLREKDVPAHPHEYDLMLSHRYVLPEYRDHKGVGSALYREAETWAQQLADTKGEDVVLALSTDQPLTMQWAAKLGYAPYPEDQGKYDAIGAGQVHFEEVVLQDSKGQDRNPSLTLDGEPYRIMFRKTLHPSRAA